MDSSSTRRRVTELTLRACLLGVPAAPILAWRNRVLALEEATPQAGETPPLACTVNGNCSVLTGETIQDDSELPSGSDQRKDWELENAGRQPIEDCVARPIFGSGLDSWKETNGEPQTIPIPRIEPGEKTTISLTFKVPEQKGNFLLLYEIEHPNGFRFGQPFWLSIKSI